MQSLLLGQLGSFRGEVHVLHGGASSGGVLLDVLQVVDGGLQTVLGSTQARTDAVDRTDGLVDNGQSVLGIGGASYIGIGNVGFVDETVAEPNRANVPPVGVPSAIA